ncbi:MAG: hypothetical protein A49_22570 [Methyloceanibacter sp.]|nr:MAG: hypothetical protein A49_22570 [Methyloceanibacter sp.]
MLDERFAYDPNLPAAPAVQQNAIRDRYAVLWDILIEGKLVRSGKISAQNLDRLWTAYARGFSSSGRSAPREEFDKLLTFGDYTHPQLLSWATETVGFISEGSLRGKLDG